MDYDFLARNPTIVSQFRSKHGVFCDFYFFENLRKIKMIIWKKCMIKFSESNIWDDIFVRLSEHSVMGYEFFAKDPIIVSQSGSEHRAISDFQFFRKSLKNQNDHLKKVCDELFSIKNLRLYFCSSVRALRHEVWLFCRRPHNSVPMWVQTGGVFWFSIFSKFFEKSK